MTVRLKVDTLFLKQRTLAAPAWGGATFFVDNTMTRQ